MGVVSRGKAKLKKKIVCVGGGNYKYQQRKQLAYTTEA